MKNKPNGFIPGSNPDPKTPPPPPPGWGKEPIGVPLHVVIPELKFPRKLESCTVRLWYGSEFIGRYSTDDFEIWLLAPNVVKIDSGSDVIVTYNAIIEVNYHNYIEKD